MDADQAEWQRQQKLGGKCPLCAAPTRMFYDSWNT
jgi:hypothetical protein